MKWFLNLGIRWKLVIPLSVIALLLVFSSLRSQYSEGMQAKAINQVTSEEIPMLNLVQQADRDFHQVWVAERSMLTLRVGSDDYKAMQVMHDENLQQIRERMQKVTELNLPEAVQKLVVLFWEDFPKWEEVTQRIEQERSSDTRSGRSTAIGLSYKEGAELFELTRGYLDKISDLVIDQAQNRSVQLDRMYSSSRFEHLTVLAISLAICISIVIVFPNMITKDLCQIIHRIGQLAEGGGDLTKRMNINRKDELGMLGANLDRFIHELNELVRQIIHNSTESSKSVMTLSQMVDEARVLAEEQSSSIDMVASSTNEMSDSIQEVANNTHEAAESARSANKDAEQGQNHLQQTQRDIEVLSKSVTEVVEAISRIENVTVNVGSVLTVISGIAEQTNLLALNAAIEAARAGEQGRGFAVVADEVRALAGKTQQSTDDVRDMISNLEQRVKEAVSLMNVATDNANNTLDSSNQTRETISAMTHSIANVNNLMEHIVSVTEQQNGVARDIKSNIDTIQSLSKESMKQTLTVDHSSKHIKALQAQLSAITAKFTV